MRRFLSSISSCLISSTSFRVMFPSPSPSHPIPFPSYSLSSNSLPFIFPSLSLTFPSYSLSSSLHLLPPSLPLSPSHPIPFPLILFPSSSLLPPPSLLLFPPLAYSFLSPFPSLPPPPFSSHSPLPPPSPSSPNLTMFQHLPPHLFLQTFSRFLQLVVVTSQFIHNGLRRLRVFAVLLLHHLQFFQHCTLFIRYSFRVSELLGERKKYDQV